MELKQFETSLNASGTRRNKLAFNTAEKELFMEGNFVSVLGLETQKNKFRSFSFSLSLLASVNNL